jgi:hypothetical protein
MICTPFLHVDIGWDAVINSLLNEVWQNMFIRQSNRLPAELPVRGAAKQRTRRQLLQFLELST